MLNSRPGQEGRSTITLWLTELRTFRRSRRILALCPLCEGRMAKAYWPPGEWNDGFCCRRCTGITDASNQREDKRVNAFRRDPGAAFEEIERHGPRWRLAMGSLPGWLTGGETHPGGKRFRGRLTDYIVEQGWVEGLVASGE